MKLSNFELNQNQRAAVGWNEGPLLVLAGPGSGKTMVLTLRAARILTENIDSSVLALTFTTKAADEMRERLDKLMGGRADRSHLCTFHSFAGDILRQHGSHVGIRPDFALLTLDEDRIVFLEDVIREMHHVGIDTSPIPSDLKNLLVIVDRLFSESYEGGVEATGIGRTPPWLSEVFTRYCKLLQEKNRLDYGSLLWYARRLLKQHSGVARMTRLAWQFVCVDEFQDTNRAQYDLLRCILPDSSPNLFVVADDDQLIYQWNGASPERLQAIRHDYKMEIIQLPENFRCPPMIVQLANNLIAHNKTRTEGKVPLIANKPLESSQAVSVEVYNSETEELASIAKAISHNGWKPEDCAVLARTTKILQAAAQALSGVGFQTYLAQRKNEFESPCIRWFHAALRLANARHDREFLRRVCVAWKSFADVLIEVNEVEAIAAINGGDFLRAWVTDALSKVTDESLIFLLNRLQSELVDKLMFMDLIDWFLSQSRIDDALEKEEFATWAELHGAFMREHAPENITLNLYLQEMDLKSKAAPRQLGAIPCLTVHGSKGMEFRHVFLVGMADEIFPSYQAIKKGADSKEIEEERRNCFVAITRVERTLRISWSNNYYGWGKRPSRFIEEMGFKFNV